MKLSQWAREQGLTYKGAWRMWRAGQLPVPAEPLPTGTIMVKEIKTPAHAVALYARVNIAFLAEAAECRKINAVSIRPLHRADGDYPRARGEALSEIRDSNFTAAVRDDIDFNAAVSLWLLTAFLLNPQNCHFEKLRIRN